MASLTGTKIKDTYDGLLKTTDNGGLGASAKQLTDGLGTASPLYLSTSGVGINTSTPDALFSVVTSSANSTAVKIGGVEYGGTQRGLTIKTFQSGGGDDCGVEFNAAENLAGYGSFVFKADTAERMRIDSSGNVGIKTASPNSYYSKDLVVQAGSEGGITIASSNTSNVNYFMFADGTSGASAYIGYIGYSHSDNSMSIATNGTERMRIDSSGNVGIGVSPIDKVHAAGGFTSTGLAVPSNTSIGSIQLGYDGTNGMLRTFNSSPIVLDTYGHIQFDTSGSERMRITSGGYLKASNNAAYGTAAYHELRTNANARVAIISNDSSTLSTENGLSIIFSAASPNNTTSKVLNFEDSTATRFIVYSNGNVVNSNNSYGAISDAKLKENVVDASPKLDDLMQVQVRNFNYIGDDKKQLGVVAQELETVFPSMIDESPDFEEREVELRDENGEIVYETEQVLVSEEVAEVTEEVLHEAIAEELDADGNVIVEAQEAWTETVIVTPFQEAVYETVTTDVPVMTTERVDLGTVTKSVKYSVFVPMLIKAIQELKAEVDALKGA